MSLQQLVEILAVVSLVVLFVIVQLVSRQRLSWKSARNKR